MVQVLLNRERKAGIGARRRRGKPANPGNNPSLGNGATQDWLAVIEAVAAAVLVGLVLGVPAHAASKSSKPQASTAPVLLLEGNRKLTFERSLSDEREVRAKRGLWKHLLEVAIGEPQSHFMVRPYGVVTDSRGRVLITDPGARGIHVFDPNQQKYRFIARYEGKELLRSPQCIAVDGQDNIYVTDSELGKIEVFDANGKFQRAIGSLGRGEGFFKRPTGIAVDSGAHHIFVSDTLRDTIFVLDMNGEVLQTIGKRGSAEGELRYPTELRLAGDDLLVVDAMNFRVQVFSTSGQFRYAIGRQGDGTGGVFRAKGIGIDSEDHIYIVDALSSLVQVFDRSGQLLYYFGGKGTGFGDFQLPAGLFIDRNDRVFVVDSFNRRVQIFQYFHPAQQGGGRTGVGGAQ
ncbi:MAG: 6-bladed beta-propeller [Acidobacteria bacterium]|nr:6-bladed beta-propeller [Acidobacteriota bacterium]